MKDKSKNMEHFSSGSRLVLVVDRRDKSLFVYESMSAVAREAGVSGGYLRNMVKEGVVEDFRGYKLIRMKEFGGADFGGEDGRIRGKQKLRVKKEAVLVREVFGERKGKDVFGVALDHFGGSSGFGMGAVIDPDELL